MAQGAGGDRRLPAAVQDLPADLAFVLGIVALAIASIFIPGINQSPIRVLFALPVMLFIPGYVFIAALFPEAGDTTATDSETTPENAEADSSVTASAEQSVSETAAAIAAQRGGIDGIERVALSFGTSIAIVPLIGLVLNLTPWGIRLIPPGLSLSQRTSQHAGDTRYRPTHDFASRTASGYTQHGMNCLSPTVDVTPY
jgi:uncharacterized membrane protein